MNSLERKQFTFYVSFYKAVGWISDPAQRAAVYDAICAYGLNGTDIDPATLGVEGAIAWEVIAPVLEAGRQKAVAGQLGGAVSPNASKDKVKDKVKDKSKDKDKNKNKEKKKNNGYLSLSASNGEILGDAERFAIQKMLRESEEYAKGEGR